MIRRQSSGQNGYTLVELVISMAIGAVLMTGLMSVIFTGVRGVNVATARIEASSQIRNFILYAYDDFARSGPPNLDGCSVPQPASCTITLRGKRPLSGTQPTSLDYDVTYSWDSGSGHLDRVVDGYAARVATNVRTFRCELDDQTVVVHITVTIQNGAPSDWYSQSQILRFYPRVQA